MKPRYRLHEQAVKLALRELGLTLPVWIALDEDARYVQGRYLGVMHENIPIIAYHWIRLHPNMTPAQASKTLWHELTHAVQWEQRGSNAAFDEGFEAELDSLGIPHNITDYDCPPSVFNRYVHRLDRLPSEQEAARGELFHYLIAPLALRTRAKNPRVLYPIAI